MREIFMNITFNVGMLVLIAYLLTKVPMVKTFISSEESTLMVKLMMAVIFGGVGIIATYIGIPVEGAIANARVIGVIAGGLLGGPLVGIGAGLIAGIHRYFIDIGGFTAVACAISTIVEGLLGGLLSGHIKKMKNQWAGAALVTLLAEFAQMGIILLVARPFDRAMALVEVIAVPMILFNSLGVIVFIGIFDSIFMERSREAAERIHLVLDIADRCLPHFRKGLYAGKDLDEAGNIILQTAEVSAVVITDCQKVLSYVTLGLPPLPQEKELPALVLKTLDSGRVEICDSSIAGDGFYNWYSRYCGVCAPLTQGDGERIGTLVLFIRKYKHYQEAEAQFAGGLAKLLSTQLEISQVQYQKELLKKAELRALQSQINPHFLFNALSTITVFCREKPERARELLLVLSSYFRDTLRTNKSMISIYDEMRHVHAYVELEKARFEDKLEIEEDIAENLDCMMPSFIIQPLVENAVKHGAMKNPVSGIVRIEGKKEHGMTVITIADNGPGISAAVCEKLYSENMSHESVGLANVHKRLKSIYGNEFGLKIEGKATGTKVTIRIPDRIMREAG